MHGDYMTALYLVAALVGGTLLSLIFGFWLIGALIWGDPGRWLILLGGLSWIWWACIGGRFWYMHLTGQGIW